MQAMWNNLVNVCKQFRMNLVKDKDRIGKVPGN